MVRNIAATTRRSLRQPFVSGSHRALLPRFLFARACLACLMLLAPIVRFERCQCAFEFANVLESQLSGLHQLGHQHRGEPPKT